MIISVLDDKTSISWRCPQFHRNVLYLGTLKKICKQRKLCRVKSWNNENPITQKLFWKVFPDPRDFNSSFYSCRSLSEKQAKRRHAWQLVFAAETHNENNRKEKSRSWRQYLKSLNLLSNTLQCHWNASLNFSSRVLTRISSLVVQEHQTMLCNLHCPKRLFKLATETIGLVPQTFRCSLRKPLIVQSNSCACNARAYLVTIDFAHNCNR